MYALCVEKFVQVNFFHSMSTDDDEDDEVDAIPFNANVMW